MSIAREIRRRWALFGEPRPEAAELTGLAVIARRICIPFVSKPVSVTRQGETRFLVGEFAP